MPQKTLEALETQINTKLKRNALLTGVCSLAAFSLLIPAFSVEGSKFDYQEFCFRPPSVPPTVYNYCTGKRKKRGIAWRVALERANNIDFKSKVTMLGRISAQNPSAGIYGLCGALFFGGAFCFFKSGTEELEKNLDVVVANKKILVVERSLEADKHLSIQKTKVQQEEEFVKDLLSREHGEALYSLMSDGERELAAARHAKGEKLDETGFLLQLAELKAKTAEQQEKELKHKLEMEKLSKGKKGKSDSTSASGGNEAAKAELIEKLKEHEGGWLYTVVNSHKPVFVIGSQGSWKSYCSATIALARYYLKGQKIVSIVDPHFNKNASESWKELIALEPECYGSAQDWEGVGQGILAGFERWNTRTLKDEPFTSIWDEQTNWTLHEECGKAAKDFMGKVISDPRKANEAPLVITHSFTNAGTGGGAGFAQAREEGVLQLWLNSDNDMKPLFKGKLLGFKDDEGELINELKVTIPKDWFRPDAIAKMFKEGQK